LDLGNMTFLEKSSNPPLPNMRIEIS